MGLFDKVFGKSEISAPEKFSKQEAFLAVAVATSGADGHIAQSEIHEIANYLNRMKMFEGYTGNQMQKIFDKLLQILKTQGPGGLIARAKGSLPENLRETAFACAVDIALADGVLEESEKSLLNDLQQSLEVPENIAVTIIQVMMIKNRG